jgi:hypothetical protein
MTMKDLKTPFGCSKFPWARTRISSKIIDNFGTRSEKVRQYWPRCYDVTRNNVLACSTVRVQGVTGLSFCGMLVRFGVP